MKDFQILTTHIPRRHFHIRKRRRGNQRNVLHLTSLVHNSLNDLLFFDKEGTDNTLSNLGSGKNSSVGTVNGLASLWGGSGVNRSQCLVGGWYFLFTPDTIKRKQENRLAWWSLFTIGFNQKNKMKMKTGKYTPWFRQHVRVRGILGFLVPKPSSWCAGCEAFLPGCA